VYPEMADLGRASVVPRAGGALVGGHAQAAGLHRSLGLVAEVLSADPGAVREHAAQGQDPVRFALSVDEPRALDGGLRQAADQARGAAADPEGERGPAAEAVRDEFSYQ